MCVYNLALFFAMAGEDAGTSITKVSQLDFGNPLYLHPSDISTP